MLLIILSGWAIRIIGYKYNVFFYYYRRGDEPAAYHKALLYLSAQDKKAHELPLTQSEEEATYLGSALLGAGGVLPGPLQNMILAFGIRRSGDIEGAHILTLMLHCLAILLVFHGTLILFGRGAALMTAMMTSLFFWPVYYSFGMWHPHFIPVMSSLTFWALALYERYRKPVFAGLAAFFYTLFFQFHLIGAFLVFFIVFYFIFFVENKKHFLIGTGTGVIFALILFYRKYLSVEFTTGFSNIRNLMIHGLFHIEVLKIFSNVIVVGSAEISRVIYGGFKAYLAFYRKYMGSFAAAVPIILLSLALPAYSYYYIFRHTFIRLFRTNIKKWKETISGDRSLFFISAWFFIPWAFYLIRLKYHELRFVALDFPVMYTMFSIALMALHARIKRKIIPVLISVIVIFNIALSFFTYDWGGSFLAKEPHMIFSLRYYDAVARIIIHDLKEVKKSSYVIEFDHEKAGEQASDWYSALRQHINRTTFSEVLFDPSSENIYRLSNTEEIKGYKMLHKIYTVHLHKKKK
ncbi:hypothetical protein ACFL6D_02430 [Spirochaetota bacterium]